MTHDELLAKINDEIDNGLGLMAVAILGDALRAVVELHKQIDYVKQFSDGEMLEREFVCNHCNYDYPCPTIRAIEKELN